MTPNFWVPVVYLLGLCAVDIMEAMLTSKGSFTFNNIDLFS